MCYKTTKQRETTTSHHLNVRKPGVLETLLRSPSGIPVKIEHFQQQIAALSVHISSAVFLHRNRLVALVLRLPLWQSFIFGQQWPLGASKRLKDSQTTLRILLAWKQILVGIKLVEN